MNGHPTDDVLSAHVDGELPPEKREEVERHLQSCERCGSFVRRSRALMANLEALPREIPPPRDLRPVWRGRTPQPPGIEAEPLPHRVSSRTYRRYWIALAAAALVALGSAVLLSRPWSGPGSTGEPTPLAPLSGLAEADPQFQEYERASSQLDVLYRRRRAELPAEATEPVDASLASLDDAIARTALAAAEHPDAPLVRRMLATRYERKIELLRRTLDLE